MGTLSAIRDIGVATPPVNYDSSLKVHPAYEVELIITGANAGYFGVGGGDTITIKTFAPQSFSMQFGSTWDTPFEKTAGEAFSAFGKKAGSIGNFADLSNALAGTPNRSKYQTAMVWKNGQPLHLSFPFVFAAVTNTQEDVTEKFRLMSKLVTPAEMEGGLLISPGPSAAGQGIGNFLSNPGAEAVKSANFNIACRVGQFIYLDCVVVDSVDANIDFILDIQGKPMYMVFNVSIKTFYNITKQDIDKMMDHPKLYSQGVRASDASIAASESANTIRKFDRERAENDSSSYFVDRPNRGGL
jgi:hypothetical protein